jgi:hypothetical protein
MYKFQGNCIHVENQCKKIMYMVYWKEKGFRESFLICSKCYDSYYKGREGLQGAVKLIQSKGRLNICIIKDNHICAARHLDCPTDPACPHWINSACRHAGGCYKQANKKGVKNEN